MYHHLNLVHVSTIAKPMPLAAIWLDTPVLVDGIKTSRIIPGMSIQLEGNKIVDCQNATHELISCIGNISGTLLEISAKNLSTNTIENIRL